MVEIESGIPMSNQKATDLKGAPRPSDVCEVIYIPLEPGDPYETRAFGIKFRANVPVHISNKQTTAVLLKEAVETKDGTFQTRAVEKRASVIEMLKGNPYFKVDGVQAQKATPSTRAPDSPDAYRGYAIDWISRSRSAKGMETRWEGEEGLRERCGVAADDVAYLMPFYEAKREDCAEAERDGRVAA